MNIKNHLTFFTVIFLAQTSLVAKMVEYIEDPYSMQAPQEIVAKVQKVAEIMKFTPDYEVVAPKKSGIQINPWNKFTGKGLNPTTKNFFIMINPEWISTLSLDEQNFLFARCFESFTVGITPSSFTVVTFFYWLLSLLLVILLFLLLGNTSLRSTRWFIRLFLAIGIIALLEVLALDKIEKKIKQMLAVKHDHAINETVVQRLGNRDAGIKAFEKLDAGVKAEIANGQTTFVPFANIFSEHAQALKK